MPKRQRTVDENNNDGQADASRLSNITVASRPSRATQKRIDFIKRVMEGDKAYGTYKTATSVSLPAKFVDQWTITSQDDMGELLTFETPYHFKDAEAVLFNNKAPVAAGYRNTIPGANANLDEKIQSYLADSTSTFRFINQSQKRMVIEMYIIRGKGDYPADINTSAYFALQQIESQSLSLTFNPPGYGSILNHPHGTINDIPALKEFFVIDKLKVKMDPGEEYFHKIKGPRNYQFTAANKLLTIGGAGQRNYTSPFEKNSGYMCFFRTMCDISIANSTTLFSNRAAVAALGSAPTAGFVNPNMNNQPVGVIRPTNAVYRLISGSAYESGAVICEITKTYRMRAPEAVPGAQNRLVLANWLNTPGAENRTVDNIDYQNPADNGQLDT